MVYDTHRRCRQHGRKTSSGVLLWHQEQDWGTGSGETERGKHLQAAYLVFPSIHSLTTLALVLPFLDFPFSSSGSRACLLWPSLKTLSFVEASLLQTHRYLPVSWHQKNPSASHHSSLSIWVLSQIVPWIMSSLWALVWVPALLTLLPLFHQTPNIDTYPSETMHVFVHGKILSIPLNNTNQKHLLCFLSTWLPPSFTVCD